MTRTLLTRPWEVPGLLAGTKTMLARPMKAWPDPASLLDGPRQVPPWQPGDVLLGKEAWRSPRPYVVAYKSTGECGAWIGDGDGGLLWVWHGWLLNTPGRGDKLGRTFGESAYGGHWRPAQHMPQWAVRLRLTVESVTAKRCAEINRGELTQLGHARWDEGRAQWNHDIPRHPWESSWAWLATVRREIR